MTAFTLFVLFGLLLSIFWIVELIDALRRQFVDTTLKLVWVLVIIFGHFLGALLYYFIGRNQGTLVS